MPHPSPRTQPLGQTLIAQKLISEDQLRIALHEQRRSKQPLGKLLVSLGFASEAALRDALAQTFGHPSIDLGRATIDPAALHLVPKELAQHYRIMPLDFSPEQRRLIIATADIHDIVAFDQLRARTADDLQIETRLAGEAEIISAIDQHYGHELSIDGILRELETGQHLSTDHPGREYSQPIVRLIDALLADAVKQGASDIHFEPEAGFLRIRYRIDGLLRQIRALHKSYWAAMAVRIKVMSAMNIAETRAPQDGRFSLHIGGRPVDFRAAAQPTLHGENIVLRILDREKGIVPLAELGLGERQTVLLKRLTARPEGIVLVTGPTGSGKTTTLYSLLQQINHEGQNIMTLEDPVEYPLAMIRQTSIADAVKLDFATGIRSIMRQDPDIILVGEIRDAETAEMAFRAAMTGHQVYSTLHANSALGAIPRLLDIGIGPDILAGNIIGIVAQRLVRRLCPHCRLPGIAESHERRILASDRQARPVVLHRPVGCAHCDFQGYRGRFAIMEILRIDHELDHLIANRASTQELLEAATNKGFRSLLDEGVRKVLDGSTSLEEIARVIDLTDMM